MVELTRLTGNAVGKILVGVICWIGAAAQFKAPEDKGLPVHNPFIEVQQLADLAGARAYRVTEDVTLDIVQWEAFGISTTSISSRVLDLAKRSDIVEIRVNDELLDHSDSKVAALLSAEGIQSIVVECEASRFFERVARLDVSNTPVSLELLHLSLQGDLYRVSKEYPKLRRLDLRLGELPCEHLGRSLFELQHLEVLKVDSKTLGDEAARDLMRMQSIQRLDFSQTNLEPGVLDGFTLGPMVRWIRFPSGTFLPIHEMRKD
jgi:hypothetical protein